MKSVSVFVSALVLSAWAFLFSLSHLAVAQHATSGVQMTQHSKVPDHKPWSIGFKIGYHLASFRGPEVRGANVQIGFTGGLHYQYQFNRWFALQPEILFTQKSASALYTIVQQGDTILFPGGNPDSYTLTIRNDATLKFNYLCMPILGKFTFLNTKGYRAFITGGPVFSYMQRYQTIGTYDVTITGLDIVDEFLLKGGGLIVEQGDIDPNANTFNRFDAGIVVGGGTAYDIGFGRLTFDLRYTIGIVDIDPSPLNLYSGGFMCSFGYEY
jgi:hypothetical protein